MFGTNVRGAFLCAREAVRRLSTRHGGSGGAIVNVSSRAAQLGAPGEYVDYAASKAALDALTIGLAREVAAEGIRVNGVRAGIIYTEIHADGGEPNRVDRLGPTLPMQRGGEAIEVARAILWLLSEEASYSTASFIDVAGGRWERQGARTAKPAWAFRVLSGLRSRRLCAPWLARTQADRRRRTRRRRDQACCSGPIRPAT